jgi:hypothetical protein
LWHLLLYEKLAKWLAWHATEVQNGTQNLPGTVRRRDRGPARRMSDGSGRRKLHGRFAGAETDKIEKKSILNFKLVKV